jgi:hypothetical protein
MDRRWHSGGAHRPWAFADRTDIPGFPVRRKTLRKAECSVLGKAHQWACYFAHALFHIGVFGRVQDGVYILFPFTTVRLLTQLLLVASVFVHLLLNLRPLLVSLGIVRDKEQRGDLYLILSILVLFAAGSIILYYIGWNNV